MRENREPLFIAPIDMKPGDDVTLLFGKPARIERDGVEIWYDETLPEVFLHWLRHTEEADGPIPDYLNDATEWRLPDEGV